MTIRVELNGTAENPYHKLGLTQNPFPLIPQAQYSGACLRLQSLGGDPIPHDRAEAYIREKLSGFSQEFVDLCVSRFKPGEVVEFEVSWGE